MGEGEDRLADGFWPKAKSMSHLSSRDMVLDSLRREFKGNPKHLVTNESLTGEGGWRHSTIGQEKAGYRPSLATSVAQKTQSTESESANFDCKRSAGTPAHQIDRVPACLLTLSQSKLPASGLEWCSPVGDH